MGIFDGVAYGFSVALSPINIVYCFVGCLLGTIVGVLPGLGCAATMALLLPMTFNLEPTGALIMLSGIYYGAMYGGSTTSILFRIPGEVTSVVTCLDGYEMARKGRAGAALGICAIGSFFAGTVSVIGLSLFAPPLAEWALKFGPPEFFSLMMLGLSLVAFMGKGSLLKTIMMAGLGVLLGTVGLDPMTSVARYSFGSRNLLSGLDMVIIAMGMFGISEVFKMIEEPVRMEQMISVPKGFFSLLPNRQEWRDSTAPILRGSVLGFLVGILPGGGGIVATFLSYGVEKRISKHPERFGYGAIEGVASPEAANNSATTSNYIPLLTLGIPTNAVVAILLGGLMIHGITPGPLLLKLHPDMFWGLIASMYIGNAMLLIMNLPLVGIFARIVHIPSSITGPLITFICLFAAYGVNNSAFDILVMIVFGIFGYLMEKIGFEPAPLLLAFVLGPMIEVALRQSLGLSQGSFYIFISRPISAVTLSIAIFLLVAPPLAKVVRGWINEWRR